MLQIRKIPHLRRTLELGTRNQSIKNSLMRRGQMTTNIAPDFASKRWVGLRGEIIDAPFIDICRSQIDVQFKPDAQLVAERMPGFHWMTVYGDYLREAGYALRKTKVAWEDLG